MNHSGLGHLKGMALVAVVVAGVLLVVGVPLGSALRSAAALACPLMMVGMMFFMGRQHGQSGEHGTSSSTWPEALPAPGDELAVRR